MLKKVLALMMVLVMVLSMSVGCTGQETPTEPADNESGEKTAEGTQAGFGMEHSS